MKPFVLLATRDHDHIAQDEYQSILRRGKLQEGELVRLRLEREPLPHLDLENYSGIILAGSPFTTSIPPSTKSPLQVRVEADLSTLLDRVVAADFPFLGACYGVGTLGVHQGAVVDGTYAEEVSAPLITWTKEGRLDPLSASVPDTFAAFVGHKEACTVLPPGAVLLATGVHCPVQMFRLGQNLYGTQFHPELDIDSIALRIGAYDGMGYFPPGQVEETIAALRGAQVEASGLVLANFVERYRR